MSRDNALINPPMPDWNELKNEDKNEMWEPPCCPCCDHNVSYTYGSIRKTLQKRELRIAQATMRGPFWYERGELRCRVKMGRKVL